MRGLLVLCFVAISAAAPQGYHYAPNHHSQQQHHHHPHHQQIEQLHQHQQIQQQHLAQPQPQPSNQYLAPAVADATSNFDQHHAGGYQYQPQQQPLISKRFYIHSAPEEDDVEVQEKHITVGSPRKNYNVVFIKSPAGSKQKTKVRIIPAINEEKTVIYVLAKKQDQSEVIAHVDEPATTTSKPEVFFIKYKTNEEAEHAQHHIQSEYDRLGGSTIVSNEGIASVSSVIGSLDGGYKQNEGEAGAAGPNAAYLPPAKKH